MNKGFRFGSSTKEVNRKVMEERASDDYNPGNNSDYDHTESNGGVLFTTNEGVYAWRPGEKHKKIIGAGSANPNGYGSIVRYMDNVLVVCKSDDGDYIANFTDQMSIVVGRTNFPNGNVDCLFVGNEHMYAATTHSIFNLTTNMKTFCGRPLDVVFVDHNSNMYDAGRYGIVGLKNLEKSKRPTSAMFEFDNRFFAGQYESKVIQKRLNYSVFDFNRATHIHRRGLVNGFCSFNDVLYDCGGYGIYETENLEKDVVLQCVDDEINSMVAVSEEVFDKFYGEKL
jgi:hypothetical protein